MRLGGRNYFLAPETYRIERFCLRILPLTTFAWQQGHKLLQEGLFTLGVGPPSSSWVVGRKEGAWLLGGGPTVELSPLSCWITSSL